VGSSIANKYKIIELIGTGGMGFVYHAEHLQTNRKVAIKFLQSTASGASQKRFLREMELAAQLNHKNIIKIMDAGVIHNHMYMVMEYIQGTSLDLYCRSKNFSVDEKLHLFYKIVNAIGCAHKKNIIHRDLKPQNIMIDD